LTLWDATSSERTLNIMTGVAFVMLPIILFYTAFSYRTMFGRTSLRSHSPFVRST
ncbi:cytochrome d ubiquinol oxidase subunit II, partial [Vibrio cholerae]|uniref:cytochrome d ubiquinol oxidase subunit II n=1 Tax=Vibrio cholerae TaxID=666 RepID=UPI0014822867